MLLRGIGEKWSEDSVLAAIKCDHGYSGQSPAVQHFVRVLTELSAEEQRAFLRFVTGSPRLPYGGLAALRPRLTIVKKITGLSMYSPRVLAFSLFMQRHHAQVVTEVSLMPSTVQVMMRLEGRTKSFLAL